MIVKIYCQTLWPQPFTSHVIIYELNLELANSRDKSDKKQVLLSVKCELHSEYKQKLGQSLMYERLSLILQGNLP